MHSMGPIPFALSIHHFINSVGADAGFAAIIGLAILILLYFAQARETSSLRRHAHEASERIQQLEARLAQVSRAHTGAAQTGAAVPGAAVPGEAQSARSAAAGAAGPAVALGAAPVAATAMAPAAPAGVAAPALTAATRLIPAPAQVPAPQVPARPAVATAAALADPPAAGGPPPATVAGGANGAGATAPPRPGATAPPRPGATAPPRPAPATSGYQRPLAAGATSAGRRGGPPGARTVPARRGSRMPRALVLLLAGLGIAAVVVVLLLVTGIGGSSKNAPPPRASNASGARRASRAVSVNPASVTVAVLNGTAINGLAHRVASRLQGAGYKQGNDENAPDQTHTSTIVAYLPGFRRDALAVATTLKLRQSAVQQVDANTRAVACPGPAACTANVIVTVGTDLSSP